MTATYNARPGAKPGTVARVRFVRMSATKARAVLDLIRGAEVAAAAETLRFCERDAALVIGKLLRSAIANAEHNDDQIVEDLFVSACYADEGRTIRRFRPRARGRATRIRKRTCHITIEISRLSEEQLERRRNRNASRPSTRTSRRTGQEAAAEPAAGRTRRRRSKTKAGAPATTPTQERSEPDQPESDQPEQEQAAQTEQPDTNQEAPNMTDSQIAEEVAPKTPESSSDEGLGLFEGEEEAQPEGSQPDDDPGVSHDDTEGPR
ncbi:MAG: 50S ribosomal protein L22 [Actinomycetota bacterium]|nr:50S ribosomal protein L22 [Actinomycetota bacterium]